jgi:uncharacterized protein (TIGR03067 family)
MKHFIALLALVSAGTLGALAQDSASAEEKKKLIGTWRGGQAHERQPSMELIITATKISGTNLRTGSSMGEGNYRINASKKWIDVRGTDNPVRGKNYQGIYEIEGDTLKWASNNDTGPGRPKELASKGNESFLIVLQRVK